VRRGFEVAHDWPFGMCACSGSPVNSTARRLNSVGERELTETVSVATAGPQVSGAGGWMGLRRTRRRCGRPCQESCVWGRTPSSHSWAASVLPSRARRSFASDTLSKWSCSPDPLGRSAASLGSWPPCGWSFQIGRERCQVATRELVEDKLSTQAPPGQSPTSPPQ
jgi:hypothetical protein